MSIKKGLTFLPDLLLVGLLAWLSGCGSASGPGNAPGGNPDSVSIQIDEVTGARPVVTLMVVSMVQQLYATIYALPQMPANQACTAELGPHYTLAFRQGGKTLVTVIAKRDGCRPVTIMGETHDRQATAGFWGQLDQAIYHATPPASVQWLAIMHTPQAGQPSQTTRITPAATAQRLYNAILALPLASPNLGNLDSALEYQLVFHAADQEIHSAIDLQHNLVSLDGNLQSRTGLYTVDDQFKQLLRETLAGAAFAPARPDAASLTIQKRDVTSVQLLHDTAFLGKFYAKFFTLQPVQPPADCPPEADKVAGKGAFYDFRLSQWGLPILQVDVYEGSCTLIQNATTPRYYQGDQEFWDLVHQAAKQA